MSMSQQDFELFRAQVLRDRGLQDQLREIEERDAFVRKAVQLGQENGYSFSVDQVMTAMQAARRAWIERGLG